MKKLKPFRDFVAEVNGASAKKLLSIEASLDKASSALTSEEISLGRGDWRPSDYFTSKTEGSYTRYAKPENILLNCELIDRRRIVAAEKKNRLDYQGTLKPLRNPHKSSKGAKLYETFHGKTPKTTKTVNLPPIREMVVLGRAVAIEYECEKLNGVKPSRAGKRNIFRHEMPKGNILSTNESGSILIVRGPKLSVKESGINH